jgi:hypothetical protein
MLWRFGITIFTEDRQQFIFPHYLMNGTIFVNKIIEDKVCFGFLYNFKIVLILRRI